MKQKQLIALLITATLLIACKNKDKEEPTPADQPATQEQKTTNNEDATLFLKQYYYATQLFTLSANESLEADWSVNLPGTAYDPSTYPTYEDYGYDSEASLYRLTINYGNNFHYDAVPDITYSGKLILTSTTVTPIVSGTINATFNAFTVSGTKVLEGTQQIQNLGYDAGTSTNTYNITVTNGRLTNDGKNFTYNEETRRTITELYGDARYSYTMSISGYQEGTASDGTHYRIESSTTNPMTIAGNDTRMDYYPIAGTITATIEGLTPVDNFTLTFKGRTDDGKYAMEINYGGAIIPFTIDADGKFELGTISTESLLILASLGFDPSKLPL